MFRQTEEKLEVMEGSDPGCLEHLLNRGGETVSALPGVSEGVGREPRPPVFLWLRQ